MEQTEFDNEIIGEDFLDEQENQEHLESENESDDEIISSDEVTSDTQEKEEIITDDDEIEDEKNATDEKSDEFFDEEGHVIEGSDETDESDNVAPETQEDVSEDKNEPEKPVVADSEQEIIRKYILPEYVAGSNEFFSAVANDARAEVEKQTGEEFDEYNPNHIARFNYFSNRFMREREEEMRKGIEKVKELQAKQLKEAEDKSIQDDFLSFMNKSISTEEQKVAFVNAINDLSHRQYLALEEQISRRDYSGVKKVLETIHNLNDKIEQSKARKASPKFASQSRPKTNKAKRVLLASDLFI